MSSPPPAFASRTHQHAWRWLLAVLVVVVSWFAFSPSTGSDAFEHVDKFKHVLAFGCLATVAGLAWPVSRPTHFKIALALVLYGAFIEVVQSFIPSRDASWPDLLADAVGIAAGLLLLHVVRQAGWAKPG